MQIMCPSIGHRADTREDSSTTKAIARQAHSRTNVRLQPNAILSAGEYMARQTTKEPDQRRLPGLDPTSGLQLLGGVLVIRRGLVRVMMPEGRRRLELFGPDVIV